MDSFLLSRIASKTPQFSSFQSHPIPQHPLMHNQRSNQMMPSMPVDIESDDGDDISGIVNKIIDDEPGMKKMRQLVKKMSKIIEGDD